MADDNEIIVFPFAVDYPFAHVSRLFGVDPGAAQLTVSSEEIDVRFGLWRVRTDTANVADVEVTGPYRAWKVMGPPHLSFADSGLTFATSYRAGLCLTFRTPVTGLLPVPLVRHASLTVTVAEPERAAEVVRRVQHAGAAPEGDESVVHQSLHDTLTGSTASELREQAEGQGIDNASTMTKRELVDRLEDELLEAPADETSADETKNEQEEERS